MLKKVLVAVFIFGIYLALSSCSESQAEVAGSPSSVYLIGAVSPVKEGFATDFKFTQNGKESSFSEITKNKVVLLNFWGTWCGPCRREIPDLISIHKELSGKNFIIIGIAAEHEEGAEAAKKVSEFASSKGIEYTNFIANNAIREAYGKIPAVPTTYIIDKNGKIIEKIVGSQSKEAFMTSINRVLK